MTGTVKTVKVTPEHGAALKQMAKDASARAGSFVSIEAVLNAVLNNYLNIPKKGRRGNLA